MRLYSIKNFMDLISINLSFNKCKNDEKDKLTKLPQTAMFVAVILLMFAAFVISICIG